MRITRTLPAILTTAVAAVILAPPPVHASPGHPSYRVLRDARHDVAGMAGPHRDQTLPERREGDITAVRVRHGDGAVRIRVRFAALSRPVGATSIFVPMTERTPAGEFATGVTATRLDPTGTTWIEKGGDFACPGLAHRIRYGQDVLALRIPRTCLDDPAWVRVGVDALIGRGDFVSADTVPGATIGSTRVGPRAWAPQG